MNTSLARSTAASAAVLLFAMSAAAQSRPGRLEREVRQALQPGLKVQFQTLSDGKTDARTARMVALYVAAGEPPTPFLAPGPFKTTFSGYLKTRLKGENAFTFQGRGTLTLHVNGNQVAAIAQGDLSRAKPVSVPLAKGYNKLELRYEGPSSGPAQLRIFWSGDDFPAEPVSPELLFHDGRDQAWQRGTELRRGRLALAEHRCLKCHAAAPGVGVGDGKSRMPEIKHDVPSLAGVGSRLSADWMVDWILAPDEMRNQTTMPRLLSGMDEAAARSAALDIATYLTTLKHDEAGSDNEGADTPADNDDLVDTGELLFENLGCIACHRLTPPATEDEFDRVSLRFVTNKYSGRSLREFLRDPRQHYRFSRMPSFSLTAGESRALTAFLQDQLAGVAIAKHDLAGADANRGAKLFAKVGCANCHAVTTDPAASLRAQLRAPAWQNDKLTGGCLADADSKQGNAPRYAFDQADRAALRSLLGTDLASLARIVPSEFSQRQWQSLSCGACHRRDNDDATLPYVLLEEGSQGKPAEPVPNLTWAGGKLLPAWLPKRMTGKLGYTPRPHFTIRMPAFPERGELLAKGITHEHGFGQEPDHRPPPSEELAATGAQVAAMQTGLACHRCHAIGDRQATAPFEARSTNLSYAAERLRYGFYHRWMRDPLRIDPNTKMLKFSQDGRRTGLSQYYDGDAQRQFEAVWHYLEMLNQETKQNRSRTGGNRDN